MRHNDNICLNILKNNKLLDDCLKSDNLKSILEWKTKILFPLSCFIKLKHDDLMFISSNEINENKNNINQFIEYWIEETKNILDNNGRDILCTFNRNFDFSKIINRLLKNNLLTEYQFITLLQSNNATNFESIINFLSKKNRRLLIRNSNYIIQCD